MYQDYCHIGWRGHGRRYKCNSAERDQGYGGALDPFVGFRGCALKLSRTLKLTLAVKIERAEP
jgi:hypothetical protein